MAVVPPLSEPPAPFTRLRLTSPEQILAAVPYLLGFAPQRSVVVMCLRGKQVGLTMRLDLEHLGDDMRRAIVKRIAGDRASAAVLIFFDPEPGTGRRRPGAGAMRSLITAVERAGVQVKDALGVRDGRFWSYLCRNPACCPPEGLPVPEPGGATHTFVAAPLVADGAAPLASRKELEDSVAPVTGARRDAVLACYDDVLAQPSAHPIERWLAAVVRYTDALPRPSRELPLAEAVRLIVALDDVLIRDAVISWTAGEERAGVLAVLREIVPLALPPFDTEPLAALGWAAFASGDGALAAIALERALQADPKHRLARMLDVALQGGITPAQLGEIGRQLAMTSITDSEPASSLEPTPDEP